MHHRGAHVSTRVKLEAIATRGIGVDRVTRVRTLATWETGSPDLPHRAPMLAAKLSDVVRHTVFDLSGLA